MANPIRGRVGKRGQIYLPKHIREQLNLREGDVVKFELNNGKLIVIPIPDPIELALKGKKWTIVSPEEIERISEEEQRKHMNKENFT